MTEATKHAAILGMGMYVPPKVVKNSDLEKLMDTSDEWIRQRSGIEERRYADEDVATSDLALEASKQAIKNAGINKEDVDMIIVATLSSDHVFPGSSSVLQAKLGLETAPAMDLRCQCSGFVYALKTAQAFVASGQYKNVLIVGAEVQSKALNIATEGRDVAVLFGDGAGAAIIGVSKTNAKIGSVELHSQGEYADKLWIERPGTAGKVFSAKEDFENLSIYPQMEGRYVFKHAVTRLCQVIKETLANNNMKVEDIDHFIFHQANLRINEKVADMMKIPLEKCHSNIQKYGNCSGASIPILLTECIEDNIIKPGDKVLMAAFGAGFTWAGGVVEM